MSAIGYSKDCTPLPDVRRSCIPSCCFSTSYCKGLWKVCEFWKKFSVRTLLRLHWPRKNAVSSLMVNQSLVLVALPANGGQSCFVKINSVLFNLLCVLISVGARYTVWSSASCEGAQCVLPYDKPEPCARCNNVTFLVMVKPSSSHSIFTLTNISTQFLLQSFCVCVCACMHVWCMIQISVRDIWICCGVCVFVFPYNTLCKLFW